jgi:1-acyl-sn-glycerol-3-phosphate acyltransferase
LILFGHLEVKGLENLKEIKSNVILACNHASELDPILPPAALPFWSHFSPMFYVSREKEFYGGSGWRRHFYGGNFFKAWGAYQVIVGLCDYEKALANQICIAKEGGTICIFPEGRTTPNGTIQMAKGGVAYLAYITKIPVVPVRLEGTFHLHIKDFFMRRRRLSITFGKPIYVHSQSDHPPIPIKEFKTQASIIMNAVKDMI